MKKSSLNVFFISMCLIYWILINIAFADVVKLKNGREISGQLQKITDKDVVLEIGPGAKVWFTKEQVESINSLSIEEARARLSTQDAFLLGDKNKALSSSAQEGFNFVSQTRKKNFKNFPEIEIIGQDKIKERLTKKVEKYYSKEKIETRRKLLVKLGIISSNEDYTKKIQDLLTKEIAGFYDSEDKKIYIASAALGEIMPGLPSITVMHEQVHALQDQHYNLKDMEEKMLLENEDKVLAIQSIIEGEATVLMFDASLRSLKSYGIGEIPKQLNLRSLVIDTMLAVSKRLKTEQDKPDIFMEDLLFPYIWGGTFIQHIVDTKGWEAIDSIYKDMPVSSEQIMHPERYYIVRDEPRSVNFLTPYSVLSSSWTRLSEGVLGEFGFYLVGKVFLDELSCKMMSEGWGGDYFEFYEDTNSKELLLISLSKWDSERDADEFFNLYKNIIGKKYKQVSNVKEDANFSQWKTEEQNVYIAKSKDTVLIIEGAPDEMLTNLINAFVI